MVKKKAKKFIFSNRTLYTIITIGVLIILGVGAYALTPGVAPNPGHLITDVAPPSPCSSGQYLQFNGNTWVCNASIGGSSSQWLSSGSNIYYNSGSVGIGTSSPGYLFNVAGDAGIGSATTDHPQLVIWGTTNNGNLSIAFNDQMNSISKIEYENRLFTIGADHGTGTANVYLPGNLTIGQSISSYAYVPSTPYTNYGTCNTQITQDAYPCLQGETESNVQTAVCYENPDNFNYVTQRTCTGSGSVQNLNKISFPDYNHILLGGQIMSNSGGVSPYVHGYITGIVGGLTSSTHYIGNIPVNNATGCFVFLSGFKDEHCNSGGSCDYNRIAQASCSNSNTAVYGTLTGDGLGPTDGWVTCGYLCW